MCTNVAHLSAWVKAQGPKPSGVNQSAAGSSKHSPKVKVEPGILVVPKCKKATKKGARKEEAGELQGWQEGVAGTAGGVVVLTKEEWDMAGVSSCFLNKSFTYFSAGVCPKLTVPVHGC